MTININVTINRTGQDGDTAKLDQILALLRSERDQQAKVDALAGDLNASTSALASSVETSKGKP